MQSSRVLRHIAFGLLFVLPSSEKKIFCTRARTRHKKHAADRRCQVCRIVNGRRTAPLSVHQVISYLHSSASPGPATACRRAHSGLCLSNISDVLFTRMPTRSFVASPFLRAHARQGKARQRDSSRPPRPQNLHVSGLTQRKQQT